MTKKTKVKAVTTPVPPFRSWDDAMRERLQKSEAFAVEYLKAAMEDTEEPAVLLLAVRRLADAYGISKLAKASKIERESLYRAFSAKGNPRLSTLTAVLQALGLQLAVVKRKPLNVQGSSRRAKAA